MSLYFTLFRLWCEQHKRNLHEQCKNIICISVSICINIFNTFKTFKLSRCKGLALTNTTRTNIVILQIHQLYLLSPARHLHRLNLASIKKGNKRNGRIYVKSLTSVFPLLTKHKGNVLRLWQTQNCKVVLFPCPCLVFLATLVALVSTSVSHCALGQWVGRVLN